MIWCTLQFIAIASRGDEWEIHGEACNLKKSTAKWIGYICHASVGMITTILVGFIDTI